LVNEIDREGNVVHLTSLNPRPLESTSTKATTAPVVSNSATAQPQQQQHPRTAAAAMDAARTNGADARPDPPPGQEAPKPAGALSADVTGATEAANGADRRSDAAAPEQDPSEPLSADALAELQSLTSPEAAAAVLEFFRMALAFESSYTASLAAPTGARPGRDQAGAR
jgi:hypothetical protein